jgi:hypothetical protein
VHGVIPKEPENPLYMGYAIGTNLGIGGVMMPTLNLIASCYNDFYRRMKVQERLIQSFEPRNYLKDSITIRLPQIDILDLKTAQAWIQARKILQQLGARFAIRVQIQTSMFFGLLAILTFLITFIYLNGDETSNKLFSNCAIYMLWITYVVMAYYCIQILVPLSYINQWSRFQIKYFLELRQMIIQAKLNNDILFSHPSKIKNRMFKFALLSYRD